MSITQWQKKINFNSLFAVLAVFGIIFAFGLADILTNVAKHEPIKIETGSVLESAVIQSSPAPFVIKSPQSSSKAVIASKIGKKYHLLDCPGAKTISEKNKIIFKNRYEAETAGYKPAKNCKELNR